MEEIQEDGAGNGNGSIAVLVGNGHLDLFGPIKAGWTPLERRFINSFEMKLDAPPILLPEQPNLHSRLPGHGATWQDWNRYLFREAKEVMPTIGEGIMPLPVFAWILVRLTSCEPDLFTVSAELNKFTLIQDYLCFGWEVSECLPRKVRLGADKMLCRGDDLCQQYRGLSNGSEQ